MLGLNSIQDDSHNDDIMITNGSDWLLVVGQESMELSTIHLKDTKLQKQRTDRYKTTLHCVQMFKEATPSDATEKWDSL